MDLWAMEVREKRAQAKVTVLNRPGGRWYDIEVGRIVNGLKTSVSQHPQHPEFLLVAGEYTKAQVLKAMWGGQTFSCIVITGLDDQSLPFTPEFI